MRTHIYDLKESQGRGPSSSVIESQMCSTNDAAILAQVCVVAIGTTLIHIHTYTPTHILLLTPCSTVHPVANPNHHPCYIAAHPFALPVLDSSRISVTCYNKHARRKTRVNPGGELLTVVAVPVTNNHTTIYLTSQLSCRIPCATRASPTPQLVGPWYTSQILRGLPEV